MGKQKQGHVHMVNLSAYSTPTIKEDKTKGWVQYKLENSDKKYTAPNGYFLYLYDRAKGSTTNGSVILGMKQMIYGKGLGVLNVGEDSSQMDTIKKIISDKDLKKAVSDRKKLMMCALQITKNAGLVTDITYFPMSDLLPEIKDEDGDIRNWFYSNDWTNVYQYPPKAIPAFGFGGESGNEILIIGNYDGESEYFCEDEGYTGCLPYALLEEEIADYQINETLNGFSPTTIVNYNNGVPEQEQKRKDIAEETTNKLTGATGKKVIVAFNNDAESAATVEKIALDNAPAHYEYLSKECESKILKGHRAISELLGFSADSAGFSNNSEELKNKFLAFDNFVINPFQLEFTDALEEVLAINGINEELYFITLEPFAFVDTDGMDKETEEEETGITDEPEVTLSEEIELTEEDGETLLTSLDGETIDEEWELVESREYEDGNDNHEDWANRLIKSKDSLSQKLASIIKSKPSGESYLDKSFYKVRYSYQQKYSSGKSRSFCSQMMTRTLNGVVYRLEDIDKASRNGVNRELGHKKAAYDLFKFKGGVRCSHFWSEELYRLKKKTDGTFVEDKALSSSEEVESIPSSYRPRPSGHKRAKQVEKDRLDQGHHPNYFK